MTTQKAHKKQEIREQGTGSIKFPCSFFVEWKSVNGKQTVASPNRYKLIKGKLTFNEKLLLVVKMIYDLTNQLYLKKQSIIMVNLISNSRPQDPKLVGRVMVQLSSVANSNRYGQIKTYPLQYCSVDGTLTFKIILKQWIPTNFEIRDLERSQLSQFQAISIQKLINKQDTKSQANFSGNLQMNRANSEKSQLNQSGFQQRINKLRAQTQLMKSEATQGLVNQNIQQRLFVKSNNAEKNEGQQKQENVKILQNYLSVPSLSKQSKEFQSDKTFKDCNDSHKNDNVISPFMPKQQPQISIKKEQAEHLSEITKIYQEEKEKMIIELKQLKQQNNGLKRQVKEQAQIISQQQHIRVEVQKALKQKSLKISQLEYTTQMLKQMNYTNTQKINETAFKNEKLQGLVQSYYIQNKDLLEKVQHYERLVQSVGKQSSQIDNIETHNDELIYLQHKVRDLTEINHQLSASIVDKDRQIILLNGIVSKHEPIKDEGRLEHQLSEAYFQVEKKKHQLETVINNHLHTKLELKELRDKNDQISTLSEKILRENKEIRAKNDQIQQLLERFMRENQDMKVELKEQRAKYYQIQQLSEEVMKKNQQIQIQLQDSNANMKQLQDEYINNFSEQKQKYEQKQNMIVEKMNAQLSQISNSNLQLKEQLSKNQQIILTYQQQQIVVSQQLELTKKQLDELEIKYLQQQQQLTQQKVKSKDLQLLLKGFEEKYLNSQHSLTKKEQQIDSQQRKNTDFLRRLKEKEESIGKLQRQNQQFQSRFNEFELSTPKYKQKIKSLQSKICSHQQQIKALQIQKNQIRTKLEKEINSQIKQVNRLRQSVESSGNKKKELDNLLTQASMKNKSTQDLIKQLEEKIQKHTQRQKLIKQNLDLLESESNKLADVLQSKEKNQQQLNDHIQILNQDIIEAKVRIGQLENQCQLFIERNQGLESEIELLNAYQPSQEQSNQFSEMNKKLMDKNKDLIRQLEEKNQLIVDLQRIKGKQAQQQVSNSRVIKQKRQLEQRYHEIVQQNERLNLELDKLHSDHKIEMQLVAKVNNQALQQLNEKVQSLYMKNIQKELQYQAKQLALKEEKEKVQAYFQQQYGYQMKVLTDEINQLNANQKKINLQLQERLHQLQTAKCQIQILQKMIGQKQANQKDILQKNHNLLKLIQDIKQEPQQAINVNIHSHDQQLQQQNNNYRYKLQFYESQINKLHQKEFVQEQEVLNLQEQLKRMKENTDQHGKHISFLEEQIASFRQRQTEYIQQNQCLNHKITDLELEKIQNNLLINGLKEQLEKAQDNQKQQSKESTPIKHFQETPSPIENHIDLNDIVVEISDILSRRKAQQDLENALRLVIDNNSRQYEDIQTWERQRGIIQEKAKLASKEIQKVKSSIIKTANKSIVEKTQLTNLLKPTELIINELINLSETLTQMNLYNQQYEQQQLEQQQFQQPS